MSKNKKKKPPRLLPPQPGSRQTAVRHCLKMLEACYPRAFVPKGDRGTWMVPLLDVVWDQVRVLVGEWGFDETVYWGVRSEYCQQLQYWEAVIRIGIKGDLNGIPGTVTGVWEHFRRYPDALVTKEERKKARHSIATWSRHHYPQTEQKSKRTETAKATESKFAGLFERSVFPEKTNKALTDRVSVPPLGRGKPKPDTNIVIKKRRHIDLPVVTQSEVASKPDEPKKKLSLNIIKKEKD